MLGSVKPQAIPGRKPLSHNDVLTGILFVLKTGIPWKYHNPIPPLELHTLPDYNQSLVGRNQISYQY
jgi:hypothetical protein